MFENAKNQNYQNVENKSLTKFSSIQNLLNKIANEKH